MVEIRLPPLHDSNRNIKKLELKLTRLTVILTFIICVFGGGGGAGVVVLQSGFSWWLGFFRHP